MVILHKNQRLLIQESPFDAFYKFFSLSPNSYFLVSASLDELQLGGRLG